MTTFLSAMLDYIYGGAETGYIAGTTVGYPYIQFEESDGTPLAKIDLNQSNPLNASTGGVGSINYPNGEAAWENFEFDPTANGTCGRVRIYNRDNVALTEHTVSLSGGSGEFKLTTLDFVATPTAQPIRVISTSVPYSIASGVAP